MMKPTNVEKRVHYTELNIMQKICQNKACKEMIIISKHFEIICEIMDHGSDEKCHKMSDC